MAAHAAVIALTDTIQQIQSHPLLWNCFDKIKIESLKEDFDFLLDFLAGYSNRGSEEQRMLLESEIASAAYRTDDLIRSHVVDQIFEGKIFITDTKVARRPERKILSKAVICLWRKILRSRRCSDREEAVAGDHTTTTIGSVAVDDFSLPLNEEIANVGRKKHLWLCLLRDINFIKKEVIEILQDNGLVQVNDQQRPGYSKLDDATFSSVPPTGKMGVVGLEDQIILIMERLTSGQSSRQIIPIVGMGGIGKTTLARCVYEKPLVVHHFDIRIWITISQEFTTRGFLLQIPICQKELEARENVVTDDDLGRVLHQSLSGKRYLVILDDIWDIQVWYSVKSFFPFNCTESRIIVTTRLSNLADHFSSSAIKMTLLDHDHSWKLFCEIAFGQEGCPQAEFEEIARSIVEKCRGLPLSIVVMAGYLAKSKKTRKFWESMASDINSNLTTQGNYEHCKNVLLWSYNHLAGHLKPCLLYFGMFSEDHEIRVSKLIQLWIAEGFLTPNKDKSLEAVGADYLKDLVDTNLISVSEWGFNGKMKTCYIHDLLRDLCLRMAQSENFIYVLGNHNIPRGRYLENFDLKPDLVVRHRITFHAKNVRKEHRARVLDEMLPLAKWACNLMGVGIPKPLGPTSLRVLDAIEVNSFGDVFQHINLRYVGCCLLSRQPIPSSISQLRNLQTIRCNSVYLTLAPVEIWTMKQLRHVQFSEICLPNPPTGDVQEKDGCLLENLQTLMTIMNFKCTEEVLRRIPYLRKLKIKYEELGEESNTSKLHYDVHNLHHFVKLESLHVYFYVKQSMKMELQRCLMYPSSLKKLALDNIELCWDDMEMMGGLPHLEALKLTGFIAGLTWNPSEGGFCSLKSLRISAYIELINWNANESHFPVLEFLDIGNAPHLNIIPDGIGDVGSLKLISLGGCRVSTAISALNILVEQESYGNEGLRVTVCFLNSGEKESFQEWAESDQGLASDNFLVVNGKWVIGTLQISQKILVIRMELHL